MVQSQRVVPRAMFFLLLTFIFPAATSSLYFYHTSFFSQFAFKFLFEPETISTRAVICWGFGWNPCLERYVG